MNQERIGKFIAECRKEKKMTQVELAEKLGVTDRSVSKWENGRGMPDVSLFVNLCNILEITLNEFFAGEKINKKDIIDKTDQNLIVSIKETKKEKKKLKFVTISFIILIISSYFGLVARESLRPAGVTSNTILELKENSYHTTSEINSAVEIFKEYFAKAFKEQNLNKIIYEENYYDYELKWKEDLFNDYYDVIILQTVIQNSNSKNQEKIKVFYYILVKETEKSKWEIGTASSSLEKR